MSQHGIMLPPYWASNFPQISKMRLIINSVSKNVNCAPRSTVPHSPLQLYPESFNFLNRTIIIANLKYQKLLICIGLQFSSKKSRPLLLLSFMLLSKIVMLRNNSISFDPAYLSPSTTEMAGIIILVCRLLYGQSFLSVVLICILFCIHSLVSNLQLDHWKCLTLYCVFSINWPTRIKILFIVYNLHFEKSLVLVNKNICCCFVLQWKRPSEVKLNMSFDRLTVFIGVCQLYFVKHYTCLNQKDWLSQRL